MKVEISKEELEAMESLVKYVIKSTGVTQLIVLSTPKMPFLSLKDTMEANVLVSTCYNMVERIKKENDKDA
jgi:ferritin